jgi:hypothetical protein
MPDLSPADYLLAWVRNWQTRLISSDSLADFLFLFALRTIFLA